MSNKKSFFVTICNKETGTEYSYGILSPMTYEEACERAKNMASKNSDARIFVSELKGEVETTPTIRPMTSTPDDILEDLMESNADRSETPLTLGDIMTYWGGLNDSTITVTRGSGEEMSLGEYLSMFKSR